MASGVVGSNGTLGNEMVFSKLNERTSISLGQFHYETNGFRRNSDQNHDILNAFVQHALTSKLNIQAEVRTRSSDQGNLLQNFDKPSDNLRDAQNRIRRKIDDDVVRIGAKYDVGANQHIVVSGLFNDQKLDLLNLNDLVNLKMKGYQTEIQYHLRGQWFNMIAGSGIFRTDLDRSAQNIKTTETRENNNSVPRHSNSDKTNGYIYTNLHFIPKINATVGFSYDSYNETNFPSINGFNPKLGLQWNIVDNMRVRMAWIEMIKAPLATYQTIEPTQVGGFNQLYDDIDGTKSRRVGIGFDGHYQNKIFSGFEVSKRDLNIPITSSKSNGLLTQRDQHTDQKEDLYYGYLYAVLHKRWSARSEIRFEAFSRTGLGLEPKHFETLSIPSSVDYFNPNGLFANLAGTYVHQNVERSGKNLPEGVENFFLIDASAGYRFTNRRGILSLDARNIFDENFVFQDINFNSSITAVTRYVPSRAIFARITLNF